MDVVWALLLFVFGACVGSFLNVVIYRLPRGGSILFPSRSFCPSCGRMIRWYDNIPLLSWVVLRGRCRACGAGISPRYLLIETATAVAFSGLYVCYFVLDVRDGSGSFTDAWPMYLAHVTLLAGLLACSAVDVEHWIVPLEVCWFVSLVGVVGATAGPHPWMPNVSPVIGAMSLAAVVGLGVSRLLVHYGFLQPSFLDAEDKPPAPPRPRPDRAAAVRKKQKKNKSKGGKGRSRSKAAKTARQPVSVAATRADGVDPRREVLREVLYLLPAGVLALGAYLVLTGIASVGAAWASLVDPGRAGAAGSHVAAFQGAVCGYVVGGLWIWSARILGTLAFGKEAMGLGDVHLLAAVGAVTGWVVPSVAFFVAPVFGLLWAIYLWAARNQRELPYGPWLAAASFVVMLFYDAFADLLAPYRQLFTG